MKSDSPTESDRALIIINLLQDNLWEISMQESGMEGKQDDYTIDSHL